MFALHATCALQVDPRCLSPIRLIGYCPIKVTKVIKEENRVVKIGIVSGFYILSFVKNKSLSLLFPLVSKLFFFTLLYAVCYRNNHNVRRNKKKIDQLQY